MKKNLFVTLADEKYLEYAKQVFAGAYFNAGWKGDYMLLAHNVPEKKLKWFRGKGILIKHCMPIFPKEMADTPTVITSKLYLFSEYFKQWNRIIYYDADVIIRKSLDNLLDIESFAAVDDIAHAKLAREIIPFNKAKKRGLGAIKYQNFVGEIKKDFDLNRRMFGAGMFVINSSVIHKKTFSSLINIIQRYNKISSDADMFSLNIYFYNRWERLPSIYDMCFYNQKNQWKLPNDKLNGIAIHFCTHKPWAKSNYFHREWVDNYRRANEIDLKNIPNVKAFSNISLLNYSVYLLFRERLFNFYRSIFELKKIFRGAYFKIVLFSEKKFPIYFRVLKRIKKFLINIYMVRKLLVHNPIVAFGMIKELKPRIFGMTTEWEQAYLRWYTKNIYSGKGEIIDFGCWLGASSIALAQGLQMNAGIKNKKVYAFDSFIWRNWMNSTVKKTRYHNRFCEGEDFLTEFLKEIKHYNAEIKHTQIDLINYKWDKIKRIELLFNDADKNWLMLNNIVNNILPLLIPGTSYYIEQDFINFRSYQNHLILYKFKDYLKPLYRITNSSSYIFFYQRNIPEKILKNYSILDFPEGEIENAFKYCSKLVKNCYQIKAAEALSYYEIGNIAKFKNMFKNIKKKFSEKDVENFMFLLKGIKIK